MSETLLLFRAGAALDPRDKQAVLAAMSAAQRGTPRFLDLDPWAAIHMVLTYELAVPKYLAKEKGIAWDDHDLENVLMGGDPTPVSGTNHQFVRYLAPQAVAELGQQLRPWNADKFRARYDAEALREYEIHPGQWDDDAPIWLINAFCSLRDFFAQAAQAGDGILLQPL